MAKRWLSWGLKLALSGAIIWYLLGKVDLAAAWRQARDVSPAAVLLAFLVMAAQVLIASVRWRAVMVALGNAMPMLMTLRIWYIASFFNMALPGAVGGDALRMWQARRAGMTLAGAVNSVMLERVATLLGLVLMVALTQPILLARIGDVPGSWAFPALSVAGFAGVAVLMLLDRLPAGLRRWAVVRGMAQLAADTRRLFLRPAHAARALGLAVLGHANLALAVYVLSAGLGIEASLMDCLVLVPPVILVTTLPISIAGWGVREGAMVAAFAFIGVPAAAALVLSVLFGLVTLAVSLPGGLVWLAADDLKAPPSEAAAGRLGA